MLKNHFKRRNQEDVWKNISDYKDCANQDNEITVPPTAYSILVLFYIFFPINIEQVFQLFFFPQMVSVDTGINTLGPNFSQYKMTKPFQAALEIHTS